MLYIGTKGKMLQDTDGPRLLPAARHNCVRRAEGEAGARAAPGSRDELGQRDQGQGPDLVSVLVCGAT